MSAASTIGRGAEWTPPEDWVVETDANGRRESPILTVLRHQVTGTASTIAQVLGRTSGNVSTQLREFEVRGKVRRTGSTVAGQRGGPQVEFELVPLGGATTSPESPVESGPGPIEARMQALANQVGRLSEHLERAENERDGAKARADQTEAKLRESETRRLDAERRATSADIEPVRRQELLDAQRRAREAEEAHARLEARLQGAPGAIDAEIAAERDALRAEVADLRPAVEEAKQAVLGAARDLTASQADVRRLEDELREAAAVLRARPNPAAADGREDMRLLYFEALIGRVDDSAACDRIERLLGLEA